jgi:hypothetical protein
VVRKVEIDRSSQRIDQFISGKQSTPSIDGSVVREVVTTCRTVRLQSRQRQRSFAKPMASFAPW